MGEEGQVVSVSDEYITVRMTRHEACSKYRACTAGQNEDEMLLDVLNHCYASEGDWVNIELSSKSFFTAVVLIYGLPLVFLIGGFAIGYGFPSIMIDSNMPIGFKSSRELIGFFSGILLMLFAYMMIKRNQHKFNKDGKLSPVATRVTKTSSSL